jgi:hypothetical protein
VVTELAAFYGDDKKALSERFAWMMLLLDRNKDIPDGERIRIEERMKMFNDLWEESPRVQKERTEYYARGAVQQEQRTLVRVVQARFPELADFAQKQAEVCTKLDVLENITQQLVIAPDSKTAQQLLGSISGQKE